MIHEHKYTAKKTNLSPILVPQYIEYFSKLVNGTGRMEHLLSENLFKIS